MGARDAKPSLHAVWVTGVLLENSILTRPGHGILRRTGQKSSTTDLGDIITQQNRLKMSSRNQQHKLLSNADSQTLPPDLLVQEPRDGPVCYVSR